MRSETIRYSTVRTLVGILLILILFALLMASLMNGCSEPGRKWTGGIVNDYMSTSHSKTCFFDIGGENVEVLV